MAKCDLTIHLDEERTSYRGGETVRGEIEVRTDEDVRCDGLTVELRWKTHGKGNSVHGDPVEVELFQGDWRAGAIQRYPFAIELPKGPFTYHGHYLNVVWEVRARADVPWAIDPKAEREIAVSADPAGGAKRIDQLPDELLERIAGPTEVGAPSTADSIRTLRSVGNVLGMGCMAVMALPLLAMLGVAIWQGVSLARGDAESPVFAVMWIGFTLVFLFLMGRGAWQKVANAFAKKRLGEVTLQAEPRLLRPGDAVRLELVCQPSKRIELNRAVARLEAEEVVTRGSGTNRRTYRQKVVSEEVEIAAGRSLSPGMPFQVQREIRIPADAPPSFGARDNALQWTVVAELDVARWPDWKEDRAILVHP